jgi:hypothetical protein
VVRVAVLRGLAVNAARFTVVLRVTAICKP